MGIVQAIARLTLMLEKGQPENNRALSMAIRALEEKKTGEWIKRGEAEYRCAECGKIVFADDQNELVYCPCCGSKNVWKGGTE